MKNNILIFTTIFFGIFTFALEEPETIVPENPEQLVNDSIDIQSGTIKNLQQAQERIDKLDTESKRLTNEYKDTIVEYEILNKYDNQLERITISQAEEIANITKQIEDLDETNKYVLPLLERMVITLRDLIEIDVPFLMDERMARLEELEDILFKANFSTAEKFRKIYEAYQIENEYGRTIEAYSGSIDVDGIDEQMHQKYRRGTSLKKSLDALTSLSMTKAIPLSQSIIFKHNEDYKDQIRDLALAHGSHNHAHYNSDRFADKNEWHFINEKGQKEFLERTTHV